MAIGINIHPPINPTPTRLAKNELYARHGRIFNREDLQEYFEDCSWYEGVYTADEWDSYGDSYFFNDVEMANRNLLVKTEKKRR